MNHSVDKIHHPAAIVSAVTAFVAGPAMTLSAVLLHTVLCFAGRLSSGLIKMQWFCSA